MKHKFLQASLAVCATLALSSCGKGWQMDYGKPAAQFLEADVASGAAGYVGKKITVKGKVKSIDRSDPENTLILLESGIRCETGKFGSHHKVGETLYMDGFLKTLTKSSIVLKPAMSRDPNAPFTAK